MPYPQPFGEDSLKYNDPRLTIGFDNFISHFADRIIADYRGTDAPAAPAVILPGAVEANRDPVGDDAGEPAAPFDPASLRDERRLALAHKVLRPGQAIFRAKLMQAYGGRCAITGCNVPAALEAAHIIPFCGPESDRVSNGLLLRLDLHALFDACLMSYVHRAGRTECAPQRWLERRLLRHHQRPKTPAPEGWRVVPEPCCPFATL